MTYPAYESTSVEARSNETALNTYQRDALVSEDESKSLEHDTAKRLTYLAEISL